LTGAVLETRELDAVPALAPLYAKAALGPVIPGKGGDEPPDHALAVADLEIDTERLADYARVCGFSVRESLPTTYPHVLGFPLAMALMTERSFPFSLAGLVHVANRIEQRAPIAVDSRPTVRVWAENLRPHHRGRQLDLVTEASVGGEVAWLEHSTYLRPGEGSGERPERGEDPFADAPTAAIWNVPGDIGRRYAGVSGDRNPIHLHPLSAKAFGFPSAIAHGMWTYAHALAALEGHLPAAHTATVEFRAPLRIPGRARLRIAEGEGGWELALESLDGEHRHLELSAAGG
jgi:acyl dehydratase